MNWRNEKTRQKAGFRGAEILKAFSGTLFGSATWTRTRDPMINSHLLYRLSYRGICTYLTDHQGEVNPPPDKSESNQAVTALPRWPW